MQTTTASDHERHAAATRTTATRPVRLAATCRAAVLDHMLRLSRDDRLLRFLSVTSDAKILAYVVGMDFQQAAYFGCFDAEGNLVALAEGLPYRSGARACVEAAFSTDAAWRNRGLARAGLTALEAWCVSAGIDEVALLCDAGNAAMRNLLRLAGATTRFGGSTVEATLRPAHRTLQ